MDVYFERIAGVSDPQQAEAEDQPDTTAQIAMAPASDSGAVDENGFPLSPLQDQDQLWFVQASGIHRPLASAAGLARSLGLSLIIGGALMALMGGLSMTQGGSPVPVVLGLVLATLGSIDRSNALALAGADPSAPGKLARNQVILLGVLSAACWGAGLAKVALPTPEVLAQLPPELAAPVQAMLPLLQQGLLPVVVGALVLVHGTLALYFVTRRKRVVEFHTELPPWVARVAVTIAGRH